MAKTFMVFKVGIVLGILLVSSIAFFTVPAEEISVEPNDRPKLFSFNSYMDIVFDYSVLNNPIPIDQSVSVPLTVEYWTNVPENFLWFLPWQIRNWILFGSSIGPMQVIHLESLNVPDWANIYFTQPDVLVGIPIGAEHRMVSTTLIILLHEDAPLESYTIAIMVNCSTIGRINGYETQESLIFTTEWLPFLDICADQSSVVTPPGQTTNVSINIINAGNAWAIVEAEIDTELDGWVSRIFPRNVLIEVHEAEQMVLSLESPKNFNGTQSIELVFTPSHYSEIGPSYSISIELHYP